MKIRSLPLVALMIVPVWLAACADPPAPEAPPQPTADHAAATTAAPTVAETAAPAPTPPPAPEPPPKPGKERIVGKWQFAFEGDAKAKAEADAKKKFPKDKDEKKRDDFVKKVADEAAGEWIEFADGHYVSHVTAKGKDKVVLKVKYEITKDESGKVVMKPVGKDEISKKELKDVEFTVNITDDNTIALVDPKKNMTLVFKRK